MSKTKVQFVYPMNAFQLNLSSSDVNSWLFRCVDWDCPIEAIYELKRNGFDVSTMEGSAVCVNVMPNRVSVNGQTYSNVLSALLSLFSKNNVRFKTGKVYRLVYDGGSRHGERRLVKVTGIGTTYIDVEDGPGVRRYSLNKIRDVEEVG